MSTMGRLEFGRLTEAWRGEATDFTPLLNEQLDQIGAAIGVDLASVGQSEVATTGGRRIDIVAQGSDGSEFVVENQYGKVNHDHLTRGLAYAVARRARGLVIVAEEHRDEFRAVASYLNDLAEHDRERGISVWLVEAKAVRIGSSEWAPLFTTVVEPNNFTASVEQQRQTEAPFASLEEFWDAFTSTAVKGAAEHIVNSWLELGYRTRLGPNHVVLEARGPSTNGFRAVAVIYTDGRVHIPFGSYAGQNSGIPIPPLVSPEFRTRADALFGFRGTEKQARTDPDWLNPDNAGGFLAFCCEVGDAYATAIESG